MVEIEIGEDQREYLERLRSQLADTHAGAYSHVRYRDALQFLIDQYEATNDPAAFESVDDGADPIAGQEDEAVAEKNTDKSDDSGSTSRLQRMMGLLDDHDDVWERTDSEEGRYAVTLPDGTTEYVRTKDDVRALLFQHYD